MAARSGLTSFARPWLEPMPGRGSPAGNARPACESVAGRGPHARSQSLRPALLGETSAGARVLCSYQIAGLGTAARRRRGTGGEGGACACAVHPVLVAPGSIVQTQRTSPRLLQWAAGGQEGTARGSQGCSDPGGPIRACDNAMYPFSWGTSAGGGCSGLLVRASAPLARTSRTAWRSRTSLSLHN